MSTLPYWPSAMKDNPNLALRAGQVDCWAVPAMTAPPDPGALPKLLSAGEMDRATRFHFEKDRVRYISRHAALRLILSRYLKVEPQSLIFSEEANGRPVLAHTGAGLHFNLSRSGDLALLAVSPAAAVGVDVEEIRDIPDLIQVARHHFAAVEFDNLNQLSLESQLAGFYTIWTRKEAFVKAIGTGLSYPLSAFTTGRTDQPPVLQIGDTHCGNWTMADLAPGEGYAGALAIGQPGISIRCLTADWAWLLAPSLRLR
ncbi:MAG TPA: 4'-phosphopantetheinyl transferase superfamily protein [Rhizomicrobium sp.]|nr:4'-phosphopantetheinyl transferase superfamily protein [Rhizomicrobium sp.]